MQVTVELDGPLWWDLSGDAERAGTTVAEAIVARLKGRRSRSQSAAQSLADDLREIGLHRRKVAAAYDRVTDELRAAMRGVDELRLRTALGRAMRPAVAGESEDAA